MLEMTNENFARLLKGLTIAVGNRKNRILFYQFLAAEIRALHYSYGVGDGESYKRALMFLEDCERLTLRSLVRKSTEHHVEVTVDHARRVFSRALKKLNGFGSHVFSFRNQHVKRHIDPPFQPAFRFPDCRLSGEHDHLGGTIPPAAPCRNGSRSWIRSPKIIALRHCLPGDNRRSKPRHRPLRNTETRSCR
jgi:hypothetical protein